LHRCIDDFKNGSQPGTKTGKDEKGDIVADPDGTVARERNHYFWLLDAHGVNGVGQTEIRTE
jgi:hypothetical protein